MDKGDPVESPARDGGLMSWWNKYVDYRYLESFGFWLPIYRMAYAVNERVGLVALGYYVVHVISHCDGASSAAKGRAGVGSRDGVIPSQLGQPMESHGQDIKMKLTQYRRLQARSDRGHILQTANSYDLLAGMAWTDPHSSTWEGTEPNINSKARAENDGSNTRDRTPF